MGPFTFFFSKLSKPLDSTFVWLIMQFLSRLHNSTHIYNRPKSIDSINHGLKLLDTTNIKSIKVST